ncbi:TPA: ATP-dependent RNA helicase, partial [Enterococcus faecium]
YLQTADKLLEEYSAQDLVALLLKTTAKDPADAVPVKITPERPLPMQKKGYNKNGKRGGGNNRNRRDGGNYRGNKSKGGYSKNNNSQKDGGKRHNDKKRGFVIRSNND